ncbi:MAG: hypothetical protein RLZZ196_87 [Bacteroidota bacterium]|jgi:hypothetical protein
MGIVKGLAAINKAIEPSNNQNYDQKGRWLQLKDGQSVKVRFLQEIDPDSPNYNKDAGLGIVGIEHTNPKDYKRKAVCTFEDEGQCFGCEQHRRDPKAGWKARPRFYVNVLVEDGTEDPYVAILSQGTGPKSATPEIGQYAAETGSISNLVWKLKRTGEKTDTNYSIIPLPTAEVKAIDYSKYELYDLEKTAVRNVTYADQENFYLGVVSENSQESTTSSSVEW